MKNSFSHWTERFNSGQSIGQRIAHGGVRAIACIVMGLLLMANRPWPFAIEPLAGVIFLCVAAILMLRFHLRAVNPTPYSAPLAERLIWFGAMIAVAGVQLANLALAPENFERSGFLLLAPIAAQAMLISAMLGPSLGIIGLTMTVLLLGMTRVLPPELLTASWLSGAVAAHVVHPLRRRSDLLRAMSIQSATQGVIAGAMVAVVASSASPALEAAGWAVVAGVIATSIFWLGIAILEKLFGIVSDWTLLELCSPEQPLINQLCLRAPGTYAHSVTVGNLAEAAARAIGANAILCRTMAYYHDIGKANNPNYFIENQVGENIHDSLSPTLSAQVIVGHVREGVRLARQEGLPHILIDAIAQHHGTSLIRFFYHRACESQIAGEDLEHYFRYEGPKPQTKEIAILHLADMIEAASRTLHRGDDIASLIHGIVKRTQEDGQLDESNLTFRDVQTLESTFTASVVALRHDRLAYPEQKHDAEEGNAPDHDRQRAVTPRHI